MKLIRLEYQYNIFNQIFLNWLWQWLSQSWWTYVLFCIKIWRGAVFCVGWSPWNDPFIMHNNTYQSNSAACTLCMCCVVCSVTIILTLNSKKNVTTQGTAKLTMNIIRTRITFTESFDGSSKNCESIKYYGRKMNTLKYRYIHANIHAFKHVQSAFVYHHLQYKQTLNLTNDNET